MPGASEKTVAWATSALAENEIEPSPSKAVLRVRWVVLFSGNAASDDYYPTASRGETEALTQEISELCLAFHPVSQMNLFPRESAAFLFWKAKTTGDWVVTRVSVAPSSQGRRTALEYCNLIFDDTAFQALRYNPFRTRSLNLHDRVRKHYLARQRDAFEYTLPSNSASISVAPASSEDQDAAAAPIAGHEAVISDIQRMIPGITEDRLSSDANVAAIQEYCSRWHDQPQPPPTFATWWSSRNPMPEGRFDVVLRAATPKAMTWHDAARSVAQLATEIKLTLPNPPAVDTATISLIRSILNTCAVAEQATNRAAGRLHTETAEETQTQLNGVIEHIKDLTKQLGTVAQRFAEHLSPEDASRLTTLIDRSQDLQVSLQLIVPHNPFKQSSGRLSDVSLTEAAPVLRPARIEAKAESLPVAAEKASESVPATGEAGVVTARVRWDRVALAGAALVAMVASACLLLHPH